MKKISKPISLFLALILTVSCFTGLSVTTVSADEDGQRIYFQFPTDGTWGDPQGVKISSRTGLANVYCYPRVIYGETGFSPPNNAPERLFQCRSEGNDIYSFDLSVFGEIEEDIDYGVRFSTKANGGFQTVELTMNSDCLGKTVSLTPYEGAVYRTNDEDNNRQDFYAAWEHNTGCGPKAAISSHGEFLPGLFPFYQPKEQILSDALRKWLVDTASNSYFQLNNNMVLCESLAVSPEQVYNQYVADNEDFIDACGGSVQTSDDVPCPYITDGTTKIASPEYVRTVLGIVDEDYTAAGSPQSFFGTEWDATNTSNDLHYNESTALYEITYQNAQPADSVSFKIVKNHSWGEGAYPDNNFIFKIESECDVTITFDPNTCEVNATGDGVRIIDELEAYSVIAVGNGEDTYLNGVNWDPSDTSNSLTEISDGIWEMTMEDIYAFDNYNVKFAINSIDREGNPTPNPWTYNFGSETEQVYPTGEELNAVWNGGSCIFGVDEDGSTVILRLDLRDFDFVNKTGAKMMITVIPPGDDQDDLYEIVISTEGLGTARADHGLARKGETVILTALPEDGWRFKEWQVIEGDVEITNNSFIMPDNDVEILAVFERVYSIISGDDMTVAYHWVGWEEEIVKEAAPGEKFGVILIDGSKPEKGNYFTGEFTLNGKSLGKVTGSGATWYITEFVMPECDVTLAAVQARQETLTVDLIDSEAVEIDSKAAFQINRDIEMDYDDASHVPLIDLNENGTPDISYTIVDEYDEEGVNIIDVHFYIKRLDSCDAWGSYSYSFKENDDRFSRITFRTSNRGDVDCNGVVNIIDATMIQKHLAGLITLEGDALENADADGNGIVDINDVTAVQKHIAHLI